MANKAASSSLLEDDDEVKAEEVEVDSIWNVGNEVRRSMRHEDLESCTEQQ